MRANLLKATQKLKRGGVIAYPTEAVWGIGCDPWNQQAVQKVLDLKRREAAKGVILVAAHIDQVRFLTDHLSPSQQARLEQTWPGPNTWVIPHLGKIPHWISGGRPSVAVRVTDHPKVVALCAAFGGPIVSTSANLAGHPSIKNPFVLLKQFRKQLDGWLMGELGGREKPSTIRDIKTGARLR